MRGETIERVKQTIERIRGERTETREEKRARLVASLLESAPKAGGEGTAGGNGQKTVGRGVWFEEDWCERATF